MNATPRTDSMLDQDLRRVATLMAQGPRQLRLAYTLALGLLDTFLPYGARERVEAFVRGIERRMAR